MKIVIDIPESSLGLINDETTKIVYEAIRGGVVLPEGHGDLIDRNVVYAEFNKADLSSKEMMGKLLIFGIPAVIPADK